MLYDPRTHHRRTTRLAGYDYRQTGWYFVTICTSSRQRILAEVVGETTQLSTVGELVEDTWRAIPNPRRGVTIDAYVIMPDHLRGIVRLEGSPGTPVVRPVSESGATSKGGPSGTTAGSLPALIQNFKSVSSRRVNHTRPGAGGQVWQRGFYEHVIRDDLELEEIRDYIRNNPLRWWQRNSGHRPAVRPDRS